MEAVLIFLLGAASAAGLFWTWTRLWSFRGQEPMDYEGERVVFDLRRHLSGDFICDGLIFGPFGRVVSRFTADFSVTWTGAEAVMTERFSYDSGEVQHREWHLNLSDDGRIEAWADDVPGGGRGRQAGSAVNLRYRIRLLPTAGGHVLDVNDWMYLLENGVIVNRSQFRKFGVRVAELVATIRSAAHEAEVENVDRTRERIAAE